MLGSALYYPHIDIDDGEWLRSAVLFWDEIKTIAPRAIAQPYRNSDTNILWREGFIEPLRCDLHPELLDVLGKRVVGLVNRGFFQADLEADRMTRDPNRFALMHADKIGMGIRDQFRYANLHPEKLTPALRALAMRAGLSHIHAEKIDPELRDLLDEIQFVAMHPNKMSRQLEHMTRRVDRRFNNDGEWLLVDDRFAEVYMAALAALLSKETELAALTNEEPSMGVNLHTLLDDVKPSSQSDKKGALISFVMEALRVDPETRVDKLLAFRRARKVQLAELSGHFEELSAKIVACENSKELKERAKQVYQTRIRPKLEALKDELTDNSIQAVWEGVQRAVTVSVPAGGALAYFTGLTGTTLLAAGAAISVTDVAVKTHLARNKARRASPFTYLLDVERKFSVRDF
ncbi:MAG: hypothetical protein J0I42_18885 [Bosea sp.]|uniref:DUF6236 family protein n=1 Tax=Bosea sp. (in: a-proteobacteria) TaxID=1871050 RepID=UPI001AD49B1D|nr:DUF6236 family protein [Bosea sp. (in: a-proteobacteria)]MBN9454008.1 hypothetical protein [Bosea sp. (in: a-proteobacteria)]